MSVPPAIGGVMPAAGGPPIRDSLWQAWAAPFARSAAFANARSALAALLRHRRTRRVWLPAYVCEAVSQGVAAGGARARYYATGFRLEADVGGLERELEAGDAVIIVGHFGRTPGDAWREVVRRRPDVLWIEDRAQALDTAAPALGEVVLYSPRKLVGVADGGLLFSDAFLPAPAGEPDDALWAPEDVRAADPDGRRPDDWFPLFQARERALVLNTSPATSRTLAALRATSAVPIAEARRANWRILAEALAGFALWPGLEADFAPLAFPILAEDASAAVAALAEARIWAPRHWAALPSDPAEFPEAHRLAAHCLSLPCDQRYGPAEMERVIDAVSDRVRPYRR